MHNTGQNYTIYGIKIERFTPKPTIESQLFAAGYGHRRDSMSETDGKHTIYRINSGEIVGRYEALDALKLVQP